MLKTTTSPSTVPERLLATPFWISTPLVRFAGPAWLAIPLVATICVFWTLD
ncbi:hypothetical protein [Herbiconiux sp. YIM B11900]|uniref:hypothetical protein n=1 Tax=Herbiconiux sp. YIM B11900 TaxID=3404131 RepID=UPI003F85F3D3